jgi:tetratricopeptide (TPR) repeat protein
LLSLLDALPDESPFLQLDPSQRRQRLLEALKRLLLRESQVQPLVLVCEDLHWIDAETQALLDSLVESLPTARLLPLVNYRPEYQHTWGSKTSYTQLPLDPLPPASADALVQALVGDDPSLAPLTRLLIARTEGNPFFLEESVRTLAETGALVGVPGAYRLAQALPSIQVPATVQAVLAARIDRLSPEDKRLLQTAAVIGTEVPFPLLQAMGEGPEEALHRGLAHLQAAGLLYETRLFPEHAYTFTHALTHDVAYGSLLQERRRTLHARIVATLESLAPDPAAEQVERLAHHALRGEVWDKAVAYCRQAGEKALARSASREAVGYIEQALSALPHLSETRSLCEQAIDLRLALRTALRPLGDNARILVALREAEVLATTLDDQHRLGQVLIALCIHFSIQCSYDHAIAAGERALGLARTRGDGVLHALAHLRLGQGYHSQTEYHRAIDALGQAVAFFDGAPRHERFGLPNLPAVLVRTFLAWCYAELGTFVDARRLGEAGLQIAEAVAHPGSLMVASHGMGLLALRQGDLLRALPCLERAVRICHEADLPAYVPEIAAALGAAYTLEGRVADAVPLLTQAMAQLMTTGMGRAWAFCHLSLGEAQLLAGRLDEAHSLAARALALAQTHQARGNQAYARRLLGEIAARCEPPEAELAEAHYRQALTLAEALGMRPLQAHCHRGMGTLYATTGQWEQARAELAMAIELHQAMAMTFWLPETEATLAQVEGG